jgi:hypothetical protein
MISPLARVVQQLMVFEPDRINEDLPRAGEGGQSFAFLMSDLIASVRAQEAFDCFILLRVGD